MRTAISNAGLRDLLLVCKMSREVALREWTRANGKAEMRPGREVEQKNGKHFICWLGGGVKLEEFTPKVRGVKEWKRWTGRRV